MTSTQKRPLRPPFALIRAVGDKLGWRETALGGWVGRALNGPDSPGSYRPVTVRQLPHSAQAGESLLFAPLRVTAHDQLISLRLRIDASREQLGRYLYSKLYYSTHPDTAFSEEAVVCFEVRERYRDEALQIALPEAAWQAAQTSGHLRLRLDGLPYSLGQWQVQALQLATATEAPERTHAARRAAHRQWVREQVLHSERTGRVALPHYPESVSIELTPVCNLRCPHCSSHGMPHLHKHHNHRPEMPLERFVRLAEESFPHVSVVSLVGRGEPTLASDTLWNAMTAQLRKHDVRMSCVTNGTRVRQRFDEALMPWVHELIFSIDGNTAETFETNRAGAKFERVLDNLQYYHDLRSRAPLTRRPQLTISWTLKRNNIAELPDFVRRIAPLEPDLISLRHLVVFQDKERDQSLLEYPEEANAALSEAYAELDRRGLRHESPPLAMPLTTAAGTCDAAASSPAGLALLAAGAQPAGKGMAAPTWDHATSVALREPECNWMHRTAIIMADGEVITCGKHYGEQVGHLSDTLSLWDLWNGPRMHSLRESFGKPHMWEQCKDCWLRELKWHSQRKAKDVSSQVGLNDGMDYSQAAWDYRRYAEL
jgi:radical SAM protein with 4Fe4S-binding SPASM domain